MCSLYIILDVNGKMKFDENADRDPDFWVLDLRKGWPQFKPVIHINPAEPEGKVRDRCCFPFENNLF